MRSRPAVDEYAPYFARYVSLVPETDIFALLENQLVEIDRIMGTVSRDNETYRYGPGKWSIREVVGHLIDAERVFGYRAFCISRGESASLPKFDENSYVAQSRYNERTLLDLSEELQLTRKGNLAFLRALNEKEWERVGTASSIPVSVRALAFIMSGHVRHHFSLLHTRYGLPPAT